MTDKMQEKLRVVGEGNGRVKKLTPREVEVLEQLAYGYSYAQVAQKLGITENTLKTHIKRAYSKLKVCNRTQAVLVARQHGFLGE